MQLSRCLVYKSPSVLYAISFSAFFPHRRTESDRAREPAMLLPSSCRNDHSNFPCQYCLTPYSALDCYIVAYLISNLQISTTKTTLVTMIIDPSLPSVSPSLCPTMTIVSGSRQTESPFDFTTSNPLNSYRDMRLQNSLPGRRTPPPLRMALLPIKRSAELLHRALQCMADIQRLSAERAPTLQKTTADDNCNGNSDPGPGTSRIKR